MINNVFLKNFLNKFKIKGGFKKKIILKKLHFLFVLII